MSSVHQKRSVNQVMKKLEYITNLLADTEKNAVSQFNVAPSAVTAVP